MSVYIVTGSLDTSPGSNKELHLALCVNIKRVTPPWGLFLPLSSFLLTSPTIHISSLKHFHIIFHHPTSYFLHVSDNVIVR